MRRKASWALSTGILLFFLFRCTTDRNNMVGSGFFERGNLGSENRMTFRPAASDTSFRLSSQTGYSSYLYFGCHSGVEAKTLIRFDTLSLSAKADSLVLAFPWMNAYSESGLSFTAEVFAWTHGWGEETFLWDSLSAGGTGTLLGTRTISTNDTTMDVVLSRDWAERLVHPKQPSSQYGILLQTRNGDGLVQCHSIQSGTSAELKIYSSAGMQTVDPAADVFVSNASRPLPPDRLVVSNGAATRSLLRFDLSGLDRRMTVNLAQLTFHVDASVSFPKILEPFGANLFPVTDTVWAIPDINVSDDNAVTSFVDGDRLAFNITPLVQEWIAGSSSNHGLLMIGQSEVSDLSGMAFFASTADSSQRPALELYYSLPPSTPF